MPLFVTAQSHSCLKPTYEGLYSFCPSQKANWAKFWQEMDGDQDKIIEFAGKAEVGNPEDWYNELHKFLFDFFAGNPKLLKKAAKKNFNDFLKQVAENHVNDPKDKYWYYGKGLKPKEFIRVIQTAAEFPDSKQCIAYMNARITIDFGSKIYSEWLLSKVLPNKEIKSIASEMNKKAYALEAELLGSMVTRVKAGDKLKHALISEEEFEVVDILEDDDVLVVEDSEGKEGYVFDLWNVEEISNG